MTILIAGGGTGGHLFPAIAIGTEWKKRHEEDLVHYVGSTFGIEASILPKQDLPFTLLPIRGLQRGFSMRSIGRNLLLPFRLISSYVKAKKLIQGLLPSVVIGTGGYASALPVKLALQKDIPVVLQEQNSFPGLTTRMFAEKARRICLGFEDTKDLSDHNSVFTGNPIRYSEPVSRLKESAEFFNLNPEKPTVFVTGGSQGSLAINQVVEHSIDHFRREGIQVLWQVGKLHEASLIKYDSDIIRVVPFIDDITLAYSLSRVIISRAGAIALAEIAVWGKPSVLVPLPSAAGNHQKTNAESLVKKGASRMIIEADLTPEILFKQVSEILKDTSIEKNMIECARRLGKPEATSQIVDIIEEVVKG